MAIGKASDFKIYHEYFDLGFTETIAQNVDAFNANSAGAIQLMSQQRLGDYEYASFFKEISSFDTRRDTTSVAAATTADLDQDELISVKLNRKQGPVQHAIDAFKKKGMSAEEMSIVLGEQSAAALNQAYLSKSLSGLVAALSGTSSLVHDATDGDIQHSDVVSGLSKLQDNLDGVVAFVMHHKPFYDLISDGLSNYKVENVAGAMIVSGPIPATMGRPIVVTTDSALVNADGITSGTDSYYTLCLQEGAAMIEESEEQTLHTDVIGGKENILVEWQFEYAFNLGIRGFKWDVSNGGANPTDATLATTTNWDQAYSDVRNLAGSIIESA